MTAMKTAQALAHDLDLRVPSHVARARVIAGAILAERARCVRLIRSHKPDASFDDSADGAVERQSLLLNIIAEIEASA